MRASVGECDVRVDVEVDHADAAAFQHGDGSNIIVIDVLENVAEVLLTAPVRQYHLVIHHDPVYHDQWLVLERIER